MPTSFQPVGERPETTASRNSYPTVAPGSAPGICCRRPPSVDPDKEPERPYVVTIWSAASRTRRPRPYAEDPVTKTAMHMRKSAPRHQIARHRGSAPFHDWKTPEQNVQNDADGEEDHSAPIPARRSEGTAEGRAGRTERMNNPGLVQEQPSTPSRSWYPVTPGTCAPRLSAPRQTARTLGGEDDQQEHHRRRRTSQASVSLRSRRASR